MLADGVGYVKAAVLTNGKVKEVAAAVAALEKQGAKKLLLDLRGCATGDAKVTPGFRLPACHVVHTVGPIWRGGGHGEAALLASCYRRSLAIAHALGIRSIAFPCISTGIYSYPFEQAARIAVAAVIEALACASAIDAVTFCCFAQEDREHYEMLLATVGSQLQ